MERHLRNLFDNVANDDSCGGGFCKTILEERGQLFWTSFTLSPGHIGSRLAHRRDVYIVIGYPVIKQGTGYLRSNANLSWYHGCLILQ